LEFERAAELRDELSRLKKLLPAGAKKLMSIKKIRRWRWEVGCRYWQLRLALLNWSFYYFGYVRRQFVREQRAKEPPEPDAVVRALGEGEHYLGEGSYCRYSLKRGQCVLATLVEYTVDFPWVLCHCTVIPAFEAVRPEFEEFLKAAYVMGTPEGSRRWDRALRQIRRLGLKLVPLELPKLNGPSPTLLYIDGEKARFRMHSKPNVTSWPW